MSQVILKHCLLFAFFFSLVLGPADGENEHFSPKSWIEQKAKGPGNHTERSDEFRKFLLDYDLIGMTRDNVLALLGEEDQKNGYLISSGFDSYIELQIKYESNKVQGWRLWTMRSINNPPPWQTTNVLWTSGRNFKPK